MRTLGAVLAGGRSSRFGGDKALAMWRGRPLIEHVIDGLAAAADAVAICGRSYRDLPALADRPAPGLGPLAAINAALHHAAAHGFDRVLTLPCDVPAVGPDLLRALSAQPRATFVADMPVIGIWPASLAPLLDAHLAAERDRSLRRWGRKAGATALSLAPGTLPVNINRREDLAVLGD